MWESEQRVCASVQGYANWAAKYNQCMPRWWHSLLPPCRLHTLGLQNQVDTASMDSGLWILKVCFMVFLPSPWAPLQCARKLSVAVTHGAVMGCLPLMAVQICVCWLPPAVTGTATALPFQDVPCSSHPLISCLFKQQFGKVKEWSQVGKGSPS